MIIPETSPFFAPWKHVADAVNPLLAVALIIGLILLWRDQGSDDVDRKMNKINARSIFLTTLVGVAIIYGIHGTEEFMVRWITINFSTHGAMTIALCMGLAFVWPKGWWAYFAVFVAYCALMMVLQFHDLPDLLVTTAIIFPLCWVCHYVAWKRRSSLEAIES